MDRQNSTAPLVLADANGLDDSHTSVEMEAVKSKHTSIAASLVRKNSQVQPIGEEAESIPNKCSTLVDSSGCNQQNEKDSCRLKTAKLLVSLLVGIYFGWFIQKSSGI